MNLRATKLFLLLAAICAVLALTQAPAFAQLTSGDLTGTVLDPTGAAVPGARVTATNTATGVQSTTVTASTGEYRLSNLPVGTYTIGASATGFTTAKLANVQVELNKVATANLTLQVGQVTSTVEVQEAATTIDTTTAQIQSTFTTKELSDLPIAALGSGVLNLSLLSAGVGSSGAVGVGSGPSIGGQRPRNNNFSIEGIDNNSKSVTGPLVYVPNDAVAEFTLLQNQFAPEYGHSSGGQFNTIVRSGTNEFHGAVYEYLRNRNLNAVDQSSARVGILSNPRYDNNRFGGNFGGPIMKNKLFFFGDFEYNPIGSSSIPASITGPTSAGYSALGSLPGISQTNLQMFQKYMPVAATATGTTSIAGVSIPIGLVSFAAPNYTNNTAAVGSVDYNISEHDQIRGRFIYNKSSFIDVASALPAFFLPVPTTNYLATLSEYHNFSPNVVNEFRLGYNRNNQTYSAGDFKWPGLDVFPTIDIDELNLFNFGPDGNAPQFTIQNTYQVTDNLSWIKGRHTFKFGFDGRKMISPQSFTQRSRGEYEYSTLEGFLLDQSPDVFGERSLGNVTYYGDQVALYPYFNDTWKVTSNLTLNLGLRYEFTSIPYSQRLQKVNAVSSVPGVIEFNEPKAQTKNFAPRVGIAYSPGTSGRTSIRAGFGMAYDVLYDNLGILSLPPQFTTTVDINPQAGGTGFLAGGGIPPTYNAGALSPADAKANTAAYVPDQKLPYSIQWNFGVQHVFWNDYTFEARYVGTRGVHLPVQTRLNGLAQVDSTHYLPTYLSMPSTSALASLPYTLADLEARPLIVPTYDAAGFNGSYITAFMPFGNSTYHGLALQLDKRFAKGLQFRGAYTWSHTIDDSTADVFSTVLTPRRPQDFQNIGADRSASALDRRHRFTFEAVYDVPWFKQGNWLLRNVVGNWELAPLYIYETPEYADVQSGIDSNLNGDSAGDRALVNAKGVANVGSGVTPIDRNGNTLKAGSDDIVAYVVNNPNARYIQAGLGGLAAGPNFNLAGRNTIATAPINNWDMTFLKRFSFGERYKLELLGQFFNLFNHPQYIPGSLDDIAPISVTDATARNMLNPARKDLFDRPDLVFNSNARIIQVGAKITF